MSLHSVLHVWIRAIKIVQWDHAYVRFSPYLPSLVHVCVCVHMHVCSAEQPQPSFKVFICWSRTHTYTFIYLYVCVYVCMSCVYLCTLFPQIHLYVCKSSRSICVYIYIYIYISFAYFGQTLTSIFALGKESCNDQTAPELLTHEKSSNVWVKQKSEYKKISKNVNEEAHSVWTKPSSLSGVYAEQELQQQHSTYARLFTCLCALLFNAFRHRVHIKRKAAH